MCKQVVLPNIRIVELVIFELAGPVWFQLGGGSCQLTRSFVVRGPVPGTVVLAPVCLAMSPKLVLFVVYAPEGAVISGTIVRTPFYSV